MSYQTRVDEWLTQLLGTALPEEEFKDAVMEIKGELLESYRNGQRDCPRCNPQKPRERKLAAR